MVTQWRTFMSSDNDFAVFLMQLIKKQPASFKKKKKMFFKGTEQNGSFFFFFKKGRNIKAKTRVGGHTTSNVPNRFHCISICVKLTVWVPKLSLFLLVPFLTLIKNPRVRDLLICWFPPTQSVSLWKNAAEWRLEPFISLRLKGTCNGIRFWHPLKVFWAGFTSALPNFQYQTLSKCPI